MPPFGFEQDGSYVAMEMTSSPAFGFEQRTNQLGLGLGLGLGLRLGEGVQLGCLVSGVWCLLT